MAIDRRRFLFGSAALVGAGGLGGCASVVSAIQPICPNDPATTDPNAPLTIDVHTHVFNGSDLQIKAFMRDILHVPGVGDILQEIGWETAPTGRDEIAELQKIRFAPADCKAGMFTSLIEQHRQKQYQAGHDALTRAADAVERKSRSVVASEAVRRIRDLPQGHAEYSARRRTRTLLGNDRLDSAIAFIMRNFQYRYVNVYDYLEAFSTGRRRKVDLMIAHLVDYDWPIAGGVETATSIPDQILVMKQISALTAGRVHCFAPFDPMKQVAHELGGFQSYSPIDTVAQAVLNHGFVGVKLYPPMGFRPYGNASNPPDFWNRDWLPPLLWRSDLGQRLDAAMARLFQFCVEHDVPVMAHTAPSNGPSDDFECLTDPRWWRLALDDFPGLRINFGHFGEIDDQLTKGCEIGRPAKFAALMDAQGGGKNAYADSAYFVDVLTHPRALSRRLAQLMRATAAKDQAALAQRLMYGTDWEMIIIEGTGTASYLKEFEKVFDGLDADASLGAKGRLSDRFFGQNAANFLGLHLGSATRGRIEAFYMQTGVAAAEWMAKVDAPTAKIALN
jgi:predicted TIM-barrel fold metal-dependent hydrolase